MNSLSKDDNELFGNSISYLHNISGLNFSPPALKCLYLTKARLMELRRNMILPSTSRIVKCQRCFLNFIDGPASYRIKAEQQNTFAKKMLAKQYQGKPMTKYQRKYCKRLGQCSGNQLMITCKFCKKDSFIKMDKPKGILKSKEVGKKLVTKKKNTKKIRKKDKFCGLDNEAVLSLTPEHARNFDTSAFIPLEGRKKQPKIKLKKKEKPKVIVEEVVTKETVRKNQKKLKKKNKLQTFLNTSSSSKLNTSSNLKHFLQSL